MHRALLTAQADGLGRQVGQAPRRGLLKQGIQAERPTLESPLDPMPAPAQMDDVGQDGTGEAALAVDELAGAQGDQHDADEVGGARRQAADEGVNHVGHQIHWRGGRGKRGLVRFVHPTSIAAPGRFSLLHLVKLELCRVWLYSGRYGGAAMNPLEMFFIGLGVLALIIGFVIFTDKGLKWKGRG